MDGIPEEVIEKALCEKRLKYFGTTFWDTIDADPFHDAWHIDAVCEHLEAVTSGQIKRLAINLPPGLGKSRWISVFWFLWTWLQQPHTKWLTASFSERFAMRDLGYSRKIIASELFQKYWGSLIQVPSSYDRQTEFANTRGGLRMAGSVSGGVTGGRFHYSVCDDGLPIENADSVLETDSVNRWTQNTLLTRGTDPREYRAVIVQQRLGKNDQTGFLIAQEAGFEVLFLPMWFEPHRRFFTSIGWTDPRKEEGELLWPERFTEAILKPMKVGNWAAMLQQRPPTAEEGVLGTFNRKDFRYFREEMTNGKIYYHLQGDVDQHPRCFCADECRIFQVADTAMKIGQHNDYTVVGTFAVTPAHDLLVLHIHRVKVPVPEQYELLFSLRQRCPDSLFMAVEDKGGGTGLIQEGRMRGQPFRAIKADVDKLKRAGEASTRCFAHKVFMRSGSPWLADFEDELENFPAGPHDDQVDCLSHSATLASTDAILRAPFSGDGVIFPRIDLDANGQAIVPYSGPRVYKIGPHEIEWADDD